MSFVTIDDDEFRRELDDATQPYLEQLANDALDIAHSTAPEQTGAFDASLTVEGTRMGSTDPAGHIIEDGSIDTAPHGTIRAAAEAVGATVVDGELAEDEEEDLR